MFELLLFRLGEAPDSEQRELYGINVFKVREILAMPAITAVAGANPKILGVADIRGQIIPVIDLAKVTGCRPKKGLKILLVTEFARTTQGVRRRESRRNRAARVEAGDVGGIARAARTVTSFARLDGNVDGSRLAQVLDVEAIVRDVLPSKGHRDHRGRPGRVKLKPGARVLAADDSGVARSLIEQSLTRWACRS